MDFDIFLPFLQTKMTKNARNKAAARKAKVEKVGPDLDPLLPDPVVQIATPTQIPGMYDNISYIREFLA